MEETEIDEPPHAGGGSR